MKINEEVLARVKKSGKKLLAVTKYFSAEELINFKSKILSHSQIIALGENRIESIMAKNIPKEKCHFIGNVQSRDIAKISKKCSVVHSLCKISHAIKFSCQPRIPEFFIQINVSNEKQKGGLSPTDLSDFLAKIPTNISIIGLSAIGSYSASVEQKKQEFQTLLDLKKKFNSDWKISAGTSVDYEIALEKGIDLVRVGQKLFS